MLQMHNPAAMIGGSFSLWNAIQWTPFCHKRYYIHTLHNISSGNSKVMASQRRLSQQSKFSLKQTNFEGEKITFKRLYNR